MKNIILSTLIFVLIVSCKKGDRELEGDYISTILEEISISHSTNWVIILPGLGCNGCIQEGEVFMRDNVTNRNILFVLTKIESIKILENKIEVKLRDYSNVYFDLKEEINIPTNNRVYPCIVYLENGELISHEFQSPSNNAFDKLRERLDLTKS